MNSFSCTRYSSVAFCFSHFAYSASYCRSSSAHLANKVDSSALDTPRRSSSSRDWMIISCCQYSVVELAIPLSSSLLRDSAGGWNFIRCFVCYSKNSGFSQNSVRKSGLCFAESSNSRIFIGCGGEFWSGPVAFPTDFRTFIKNLSDEKNPVMGSCAFGFADCFPKPCTIQFPGADRSSESGDHCRGRSALPLRARCVAGDGYCIGPRGVEKQLLGIYRLSGRGHREGRYSGRFVALYLLAFVLGVSGGRLHSESGGAGPFTSRADPLRRADENSRRDCPPEIRPYGCAGGFFAEFLAGSLREGL